MNLILNILSVLNLQTRTMGNTFGASCPLPRRIPLPTGKILNSKCYERMWYCSSR